MKPNKVTTNLSGDFASATGAIAYGFTNDYMFRVILQKNKKVLKALICSLLHLKPEEVNAVEITNPIVLGEKIDAKEFILDINVSLNNYNTINLEMQVKNHRLYSSKFSLAVVDLTKIDLATGEDQEWQIDHWARLFKATTWEELKMIAEKNEAMQAASETLYNMHCEQTIRDMCRAREDSIRRENAYNKLITEQDATIAKQNAEISRQNAIIEQLQKQLAEKQ